MTKEQLLAELERVPDGAEIYTEQYQFDYCQTSNAQRLSQVAECDAIKSEYKLRIVDEEKVDMYEEEELQKIWVLC